MGHINRLFVLTIVLLHSVYNNCLSNSLMRPNVRSKKHHSLCMKMQGNKRRKENKIAIGGDNIKKDPSSHTHERLLFRTSDSHPQIIQTIRKRSQAENFEFDREERQQLSLILEHHLPQMSKVELVSTVVSLGVCSHSGLRWYTTQSCDPLTTSLLWKNIKRACVGFTSQDVANVLIAAARMNWDWESTLGCNDSPFFRQLNHLLQEPEAISDQNMGDIFWGLGTTGLNADELTHSMKISLLKAFEYKAGNFNGYSLSSALWSIAKMGIKWGDLSVTVRESLPQSLVRLSSEMSPQQSSKVLWALGTCGYKFENTGYLPLIESLLTNVGSIKRSKMGSAVSASQTLIGLAKSGLPWERMSPVVREGIWEQVTRVCQSTNNRGIANAIWAMGTMGIPMTAIPEEVHTVMLSGISRAAEECSAWALCNIIWGLAKMKFEWMSFPVAFREMLMTNIVRLDKDLNSLDVAILIWSLGSIDTPLDALPPYFTEGLLQAALRTMELMKPEELSKTIWGLSSAELSWDALPPAVRWNLNVNLRRVGENMAPQDVANCAYGLAILAFDTKQPSDAAFRGAHEALLNTIINNKNKILTRLINDPTCSLQGQELEQIRIYSHYLATMRYVTDTKRIPREFLEADSIRPSMNGAAQGSRLQNRVTKGLVDGFASAVSGRDGNVDVDMEISQFGGVFPIDAGIRLENEYVALIEIDGPHHYRSCDGRLRRKDRLKETMYRKALPDCTFHRIRWDDANKVGSDIVGEELAETILSTVRSRDKSSITGFFRSVTRNVNDFFSWGLRNDDGMQESAP